MTALTKNSVEIGETFELTPILKGADGKEINVPISEFTFFSSCEDIIRYDNGKFVAVAYGVAEVNVEYQGIVSAMKVEVVGLDVNSFSLVSGAEGTKVDTIVNQGFIYTGKNSSSKENVLNLSQEAWRLMIERAEAAGLTRLVFRLNSLDGVFAVNPSGVKSIFSYSSQYITSADWNENGPSMFVCSIEDCKKINALALGMYGDGSFTFTLAFM